MRVDVRASWGVGWGWAGLCGWACVVVRVCAISRTRGRGCGRACSRGPLPCVVTSVIDVHTTTVCEHVNSLLSSERYSCVVNLGLFLFFFNVFFFSPSFCSVRWGIFLVPFPPCLLFMKLENLKDCCVFVNNKTIVPSVLVNVPRPNCYFWSPSPRGCGLFLMSPPTPTPLCPPLPPV